MEKFETIKRFILKNIFVVISVLASLCSIIGSITYVALNKCEECMECPKEDNILATGDSTEDTVVETFKVDVKGAVKKPGVYDVTDGSTVNDAITLAGGLTSNGVTTNINLSRKLSDQMVIYVFTKGELKEKETSNNIVCEVPKCECEQVIVNKEICTNASNEIGTSTETSTNSDNEKISINTDSVSELMKLDGIGESKAKAIIEYRRTNGNFTKLEDIKNVSGIGDAAYEKIKDQIKL